MAYTETSTEGWGSRLMSSIKGVLIGGLLFLVAFPLLFKNEGCAVTSYRALTEGRGAVVEGKADTIDPALDKKLVHMTGEAKTEEILEDTEFNVKANAIALRRAVAMYQYEEKSETKKKKNLGGSETTVTTYTYEKTWKDGLIDSSDFKDPDAPKNPTDMPFRDRGEEAKVVTFGAHTLSPGLISDIRNSVKLPVTKETLEAVPEDLRAKYPDLQVNSEELYLGKDPANPAIGDMKISFTVVKPAEVSILSQQTGSSFEPFPTSVGEPVERLQMGNVSADAMFAAAEGEVATRTWMIRGGGFFLMFMGLSMVFAPLSVAGDVVPFIGTMFRYGTALVAGVMAAFFSLVTIAIAWIVYRPLLGVILLAVAIGLVVLVKMMAGKKAPSAATA